MKLSLRAVFLTLMLSFVMMLLLATASCGEKNPEVTASDTTADSGAVTTPGKDVSDPMPQMLTVFANGKTEYAIVHSESLNSQVFDALGDLRSAFRKKFGKDIDRKYDRLLNGEQPSDDAKEILIGLTNRAESGKAYDLLEKEGFLIKAVNNRIVIVGSGEVMLMKALDYFEKTYIDPADDKLEVPADLNYFCAPSYEGVVTENSDKSITLDLKEFVVTYDGDNEQVFVPYMAQALGARGKKEIGFFGALEDQCVNRFEILFGSCDRTEYTTTDKEFLFRDFYICYNNNKLNVSAFSVYGYEQAINYLLATGGKLTIPADGLYVEYDYGNDYFGALLKNYENHSLEGSWMINVCHRGDITTNNYPENSLPSYQSCIDNNIDVIETDLRKTKDGVWVILHDDTLDRTTNGSGILAEMTYEEIQKHFLLTQNGGNGSTLTEYKIPTLEEIIDLCKGRVLFNLDKLTLSDFQSVYNVFEEKGAVSMAMIKSDSCSAEDISKWFGKLAKDGKELPLFSPLLYGDPKGASPAFKGLTSMIETGPGHNSELLSFLSDECNVRPMCLTALSPSKENVETWSLYKENGYLAVMTDEPIKLKEFIHEKN